MIELLAGPRGPVLIFGPRIVDVSMGTLRTILVVREVESRDPDAFIAVHEDTEVRRGWLRGVRRK